MVFFSSFIVVYFAQKIENNKAPVNKRPIVAKQAYRPIAKPVPRQIAKTAPRPIAKTAPRPIAKTAPRPITKPAPRPIAKSALQPQKPINKTTHSLINTVKTNTTPIPKIAPAQTPALKLKHKNELEGDKDFLKELESLTKDSGENEFKNEQDNLQTELMFEISQTVQDFQDLLLNNLLKSSDKYSDFRLKFASVFEDFYKKTKNINDLSIIKTAFEDLKNALDSLLNKTVIEYDFLTMISDLKTLREKINNLEKNMANNMVNNGQNKEKKITLEENNSLNINNQINNQINDKKMQELRQEFLEKCKKYDEKIQTMNTEIQSLQTKINILSNGGDPQFKHLIYRVKILENFYGQFEKITEQLDEIIKVNNCENIKLYLQSILMILKKIQKKEEE